MHQNAKHDSQVVMKFRICHMQILKASTYNTRSPESQSLHGVAAYRTARGSSQLENMNRWLQEGLPLSAGLPYAFSVLMRRINDRNEQVYNTFHQYCLHVSCILMVVTMQLAHPIHFGSPRDPMKHIDGICASRDLEQDDKHRRQVQGALCGGPVTFE